MSLMSAPQTKTTAEMLAEMLTENTGTHFLDSGGAYGRSWSQNQTAVAISEQSAVDYFKSRPAITADVSHGWMDVTVDVFHWGEQHLDYDEEMDHRFGLWTYLADADSPWLASAEAFVSALSECGREIGDVVTFNTYNEECLLSQTLQGVYFTYESEQYVLLQVHGGCDVRGGYTRPRAFRTDDCLFEWNSYSLGCEGPKIDRNQLVLDGIPAPSDKPHFFAFQQGDWIDYDGNYCSMNEETFLVENEDGEYSLVCPECKTAMTSYPY